MVTSHQTSLSTLQRLITISVFQLFAIKLFSFWRSKNCCPEACSSTVHILEQSTAVLDQLMSKSPSLTVHFIIIVPNNCTQLPVDDCQRSEPSFQIKRQKIRRSADPAYPYQHPPSSNRSLCAQTPKSPTGFQHQKLNQEELVAVIRQ